MAYDLVLEVAMKDQHFQQRNLLLHGPWKWLLTEFASYFGVSDAYTKLRYWDVVRLVRLPFLIFLLISLKWVLILFIPEWFLIHTSIMLISRYLSYVMDVATPTADCLTLVYDLLLPVVMKGNCKSTLSHQEVKPKFAVLNNCYWWWWCSF